MAANEELVDPDEQDIDNAVAELDSGASDEAPEVVSDDADYDSGLDAIADEVATEEIDGPTRGPDGRFAKKEPEAAAAAPETPVVPPVPADPFADYKAFPFKLDGNDITLDGIRANDTHVVIPREVWDRELRPNYLGSRQAWQQERQGWHQERGQFQQMVQAERDRADTIVNEFNALIADPNQLQAFIQDYERQLPILKERMRADAAERQLQARQQQEYQARAQADYQRLELEGANAYEAAAVELLKDPAFASLATTDDERDDLLVELWTQAKSWIQTDGQRVTGFDMSALQHEFSRRAQYLARREAQWKRTTTTEQRNAAAVAPPATSPQTAPIPKATRTTSAARKAPTSRPAPVASGITDEDRESWKKDYGSILDE